MKKALLSASAAVLTALAFTQLPATPAGAADPSYKVLVFSKTGGFRHDSIPQAIQTVRDLGAANGFTVDATEDASAFTPENLAGYKAVVWANTTGDVLDGTQQAAFEDYIRGGGGYVGIHSAADTEYDWPFYGQAVGAWFKTHPHQQTARVDIEDRAHSSTSHLSSAPWSRWDEWYDYQTNPRSTAHVLASLDESSYSPGAPMGDHPITWCKTLDAGRSWYTGMGHTKESYAEPDFQKMLLGGIRYAAGVSKADCRPETGYSPLYNGSTTGWSQAGPGSFTNSDATLTSVGGTGLFWYDAKQYTDYSLKLDWKITGDANSGVFIGFPPSDNPQSAIDNGYEVQIDATDSPDKTTGAVYGFKAPDQAARDAALNPPGEWNTYELLVKGERLQVLLNGVEINDFTNTDPARSLAGHVGIQNHGAGEEVSFRNIRLKDMSGTGTKAVQAESFSAADGVQPYDKAGANGGQTLGYVDPGDWARYDGLDLTGATGFRARVVSGGPGGTLQVRTGSPTGPILGSVAVPNTGGWSTFTEVSTTLSNVPSGTQNVFLTFAGTGGGLFDVDDFTFTTPSAGPVKGLAGKCLDVQGGETGDGTPIQLWDCNGTSSQSWQRVGETLRAKGKCLDVSGAATDNGAKIQLYGCNGTGAQNWVPQADGTLKNPHSGKCLDVKDANPASGTPVQLWTCWNGANQKWTLPA
ncbi:ThuA domain-containing protein [Streptomyces sp. B8F3]|uniref:ThuA domain-containing protein n=1 Tax=Streptomyces sp. B8F3 TaxID=3153573 RepID=UPI00325CF5AA